DFGDCCHTTVAADVSIGLASLLRGRPREDVFRVARIALDGFVSRLALEPLELELLGDLVMARLAAIVSISSPRARRFPDTPAYRGAGAGAGGGLLGLPEGCPPGGVAPDPGARPPPATRRELARRRDDAVGGLLTPLTYASPVHAVRAEGVWIHEPDRRR